MSDVTGDVTGDAEFLVLHGLRVKGMASPDVIEQCWGISQADEHLSRLAASGLCAFRETPAGGRYLLMPAGRERHAALLADRRDGLGADALSALAGVYERFTPLNEHFKEVCTNWQVRNGAPNDHSDHEYDHQCISALEDVHGRFLPLVLRAGRAAPHFEAYVPRLRSALAKLAEEGDLDYFTKPLIDSYHTVWFEFHEDLIATLGRERQASEA